MRESDIKIELKNISVQYNENNKKTLDNINISLHKGECLLLCGKSGCGKSTITKLINGIIPHCEDAFVEGEVLIDGIEISKIPLYLISKKVSSVFQNPKTQFFNVEVDSEIAFALENQNIPPADISRIIETTVKELGIEALLSKNLFKLSSGEKQIIAIASAYASGADIIILDEPSANLDLESIERIKEILKEIKKRGKTIIIAEHRLAYLKEIVDKVLLLENGIIINEFSNSEFFSIPNDRRKKYCLRNLCPEKKFDTYKKNIQVNSEYMLELKNINIKFDKKYLYKRIDLCISAGQVVAITGNNGQGKTTLSRIICGLENKNTGSVMWQGKELSPHKRRRLCYFVMQEVMHQFFGRSVEEECFLGNETESEISINNILDKVSLNQYRNSHPLRLSGGQKQRLGVGLGILSSKPVLILDEPTSGLDYSSMLQICDLLKYEANKGKLIIVVTHDQEFIEQSCDSVIELNNGRAIFRQ